MHRADEQYLVHRKAELLDERTLAPLDQPRRRRARLLKCTHALGPAPQPRHRPHVDLSKDYHNKVQQIPWRSHALVYLWGSSAAVADIFD